MNEITLTANIRTDLGRSASNALRRNGRVPGVFYLHNELNIPIDVKLLDLRSLIYTADAHIVNLQLSDGTSQKCVLREVQFDPITDVVSHIDLMGLRLTDTIRVEVPVTLHGQAQGVRDGGVLNHIIHKVEVECVASDLPEHIEIDITGMKIGQTITHARGGDATTGDGTEAPTEPELIGRGKSDEDN